MSIPVRQSIRIGTYLICQKLRGRDKFPLIVELEPLFACNLACAGCGKIQHPADVLRQRMPVEQAVAAIEESGAPMVSIAGGEPLMHPQIDVLVNELVKRKKYVYLCTNAVLLRKRIDRFDFRPSRYFSFAARIASTALSKTPSRQTDSSWRSLSPSMCTAHANRALGSNRSSFFFIRIALVQR